MALVAILFPALSIALPWLTREGFATRHPRATAAIASAGMLAAFSLLGSIASYAIAASTSGWADADLIALGGPLESFWPTYWRLFELNRWIGAPLDAAYLTIFATPTLLAAALAWSGHQARLDRFVLAFALALILTNALFALARATSAGAHFLRPDDPMMPQPGFMHIAVIEALRSGTLRAIDLGALCGLIAFPSFHAAAAVLFIWASWPTGRLRLFFVPINLMMLAATPTTGGHYLIECIAGVGVALLAIGATRLVEWRPAALAPPRPAVA
ncbi:phosphatase PAP2 family protein [Sphingomonas sp. Y38-1Y]|uniref:phosphatase PAP2 family protein n=1 Tax=Sphingomonas sp. Y38-1Y TaxID=3078265 RepID=UPI0028ED8B48|nr:phosphatase PAP2 family protein [Sphingomonas sp. Y38-1Y]